MESRLYIGRKFTGIVVKADEKWPSMYRIYWADGEVSDMVNLTRAKDAAMARTNIGGTEVARWDNRQTRPAGPRTARLGISRRVT